MATDAPLRHTGRALLGRVTGGAPGRDLRSVVVTGLGIAAVVALSVIVARLAAGGSPAVIATAIAGVVALGLGAALGHLRPLLFAGLIATTLVIPDVLINIGIGSSSVVIVGLLAAASAPYLWRTLDQVTILDAAVLLLFIAAALLPAIVSGTLDTIAGNAVLILGTYLIARTTAPRWDRLVTVLLIAGAIHAVVAILWAFPPTTTLVPFVPLLNGEPNLSSRATGLFNNPNTFGNVETLIVILALWSGGNARRWPLIILCAIAIILSGSREALLGLTAAVTVLVFRAPSRTLVPAAILGLAISILLVLLPSAQERFDPGRYSSDGSLIERFELWGLALDAVARSPIFGYEHLSGLRAVDQAYLNWLVDGGVIGTALWVAVVVMILARFPAKPIFIAMLVIGLLGNPFAGPTLGLLLVLLAASHGLTGPGSTGKLPAPPRGAPSVAGT
jgi:hypothetical protein